jgi:soluble lytic murein transglycosylase-like protein
MRNFFYLLFIVAFVWLASILPHANAAEAQQLSPEQEAAVSWVMDNTAQGSTLSEDEATQIVVAAYYFANERQLDPHHLLAMMRVESRFNPKARSSEGALGLMQVIPRYHKTALAKRNPLDPVVSIEVGSLVYHDCLEKANGNVRKAVSCYSGGAVKYYGLVEGHKKSLMRSIIARLFTPTYELLAGH